MTAVVLTYGVPWPRNSGPRIRDEALLRRLAELGVEIHLVCFAMDEVSIPDLGELEAICASVAVFRPPARGLAGHAAALWRGWRENRPPAMALYFYPELKEMLGRLLAAYKADILQIEHSFLAGYREACSDLPRVRTLLTMHNLGFQQYARMAAMASPAEWPVAAIKALLMRNWEAAWASRFHLCVTVSEVDAKSLRESGCTAEVAVVENGVDCDRFQVLPPTQSADLLFAGVIGYPPNADAVEFLAHAILPRIRKSLPEARLFVVGQAPPERIRRLASDSVIVTGAVPDMRPWYERCRVSVAPLRSGSGTRLKILEAMALGRPVVSTRIGCEGLDVISGEDLLVADDPDSFADSVVRLLRDDDLWRSIRIRARAKVEAVYSWTRLAERLHRVYAGLCQGKESHASYR